MQAKIEVKLEDLPKRVKGNYLNSSTIKKVVTNYYPVAIKPLKNIHIFKVVFTPAINADNRIQRQKLLNEAFPSIKKQIPYPVLGGMNIYSANDILADEATHEASGHRILVKKVKTFNVMDNPKILLLFLNNGIRNIMCSMDYIQIGETGKYFNVKEYKKQVVDKLDLFTGYRTSFLFGERGLFLRIDPVNKIVQRKTVLQQINDIYYQNSSKDKHEKRQMVQERLINKIIMTNYGKTRYVKIQDIQFKDITDVKLDDKEDITIYDYYTKKYDLKVNPRQPLIKIFNKNKNDSRVVYMLPQFCVMTGLPQGIDEHSRRKLSQYTIVDPNEKFSNIQHLSKQIKATDEQQALRDLGIQIDPKPQQIDAIYLKNPNILLGNGQRVQRGKESSFKIFPMQLYSTHQKVDMALIYIEGSEAAGISDLLQSTAQKFNLKMKINKISVRTDEKNANDLKLHILKSIDYAQSKFNPNCYLIVLRDSMKTKYNEIKDICLQKKLITQVVVEGSLKKNSSKSILTNVLLQLAAKLGNVLWKTTFPKKIQSKSMMLSFDSSKAGGKRKIAGVATMNNSFTAFSSECDDCDDIANKFQKMAKITLGLLTKFLKVNHYLPEDIIILTDSCPKNQIKLLYDFYIPQVEEEIQSLFKQFSRKQIFESQSSVPKLIIIQVKDKTNERFFSADDYKNLRNPQPGLLICSDIVSENYDFYLVSQSPRAGCSIPIHFNVIYSKSKLEEGEIQELMYHQCFAYYNWSGSIKIPSMLQYAKKCAKFCSENLSFNVTDEEVANKLYFI